MDYKTLPHKSIKLLLPIFIGYICFFCPIVVNGQTADRYFLKGIVINGLQLKSIELTLSNSAKKIVASSKSDSLGRFMFTELQNGKYHVSNAHYKLDSVLIVANQSVEPFIIELNVCEVDADQALQDIMQSRVKLLLAGGIAPVYYQGQERFEKKYHIQYYDYGCTPPDIKCIISYNHTIYKYLDKQYGKRWRNEVRKDVIGYK
jgi:uncharacterized protein (UPF0212 family)